ncbi:MAG: TrbG/VirB9 family P-type conjugative transfer protein [Rickettsiales bacterium]
MMNRNARCMVTLLVGIILAGMVAVAPAMAGQPVTTDSRIKTLVYSPNEVFTVTTHYGYQSNIEFGPKEFIDTISVGDRTAWQITPAGRRLFIRAQEENAHTNMTIVTNLRAYQFDLRSSSADAVFGSEELTYVVRFYYPDAMDNTTPAPRPVAYSTMAPPAPMTTAPIATGSIPATTASPAYNYRYTYSGSNAIAPVKIFDDGKNTYFKFTSAAIPRIAIVTAKGEALDVPASRTADGLIMVSAIAPRFTIQQNGQQVSVYNESGGAL